MVSLDVLLDWCKPLDDSQPFYRPFVCRTYDPERKSIWIVGTNPATSIDENDIPLAEYASKLMDYDAFNEFYSEVRKKRGKRIWSPTRSGIKNLGEWLDQKTYMNIIETNINVFPSQDPDDLTNGTLSQSVARRGQEIFEEMLFHFQPQIIIVHGSTRTLPNLKKLIRGHRDMQLEKVQHRYTEFEAIRYSNNNLSLLVPCTHLRFYTDKRYKNEFEQLRQQVEAISTTPPAMQGDADVPSMPERHVRIPIDLVLREYEIQRLRYGFYPDNDTRWFVYIANNCLYFHRSWTGFCIFKMPIQVKDGVYRINELIANRDPDQYNPTEDHDDRETIVDLLHILFGIERMRI